MFAVIHWIAAGRALGLCVAVGAIIWALHKLYTEKP